MDINDKAKGGGKNDKMMETGIRYHFEATEVGSTKKLFLCAVAANIAALCTGVIIGWASPAGEQLARDEPPFPTTPDEQSWIAGLMALGAAFGPILGGYTADKFGRQRMLLISGIPILISWIILAATEIVGLIYFSRILAGFCLGWIFTVLPMYIGEIAVDEVRGALGSFMQIFISLGILYIYAVGPYVSWMWMQIASLFTPIAALICLVWMPESPYYLAAQNRNEDAIKSLVWLRSKSKDGVMQEYEEIKTAVEASLDESSSIKDLWATKGNIKALIISLGLVFFQQFSGINVVLMYAASIFKAASGSADGGLTPSVSTIIVGAVMLLASCCTPFVVDRLGRRILLLFSATGMCIAHIILGVCFNLQFAQKPFPSVLPVICVIIFIMAYSVGFGPLPWAVMGELFPPNIKSISSTATASFCWILGFIITKFYPALDKAIGGDFAFWLFAIFCALAFVFVITLLPETKGKSLTEVQRILNK